MASQHTDRGEREPPGSDRPGRSASGTDTERRGRAIRGIAGAGLVLYGLGRRSLRGAAAAVAGGWLLTRALRGDRERGGTGGSGNWSAPRERGREPEGAPPESLDVQRSITVERPAEELYERWRDPETHERVWAHFAEVREVGEDRQHWAVSGPRGVSLEWDAEVVAADPGEFLRWKSLPGARVPNEGSVRFRSRGEAETEVTLHVRFDPPGGRVGSALAERADLVPDAAAGTALRRFKSLVETGEMPTLERNPSARGTGDLV
ncbi:SRPBCC family protein [Halosimplex marinum]|uniref:SRPBCC family protein n=1 Tax=Halosimplex marinum TaxID=3396620 RepID=UPI003F573B6E